MTIEEFVSFFPGGRWRDDEYETRCPAHKDDRPSLGISRGRNGGLVMCCQAGCANAQILAQVGLTLRDLAPPSLNGATPQFVAEYRYDDEHGNEVATKFRLPNKDFRWRHASGEWNLRGIEVPLFGLPELLASEPGQPIAIAEGEKDVLNLRAHGTAATTNPDGASKGRTKWRQRDTDWLKANLADREFVIFADNDEAGHEHAEAVKQSLERAGLKARFAQMEGLGKGEDVSDWLPRHNEEEIQALLRAPPHPLTLRVMSGGQLQVAELPTPEALVTHLLYRGFSTLLAGDSKLGKSSLLLRALLAAACGGWWLDPERRAENRLPRSRLLYVNWEDPLFITRDRARRAMDPEPIPDNFLTMEAPYDFTLDQVLDWIRSVYQELAIDAVIIDPIAVAAEWKDEKDNSEVGLTFKKTQRLAAETQLAVLCSHHVTKKPGEFGLNIRGGGAIKANVIGYLVLERDKQLFRLAGINKLSGQWDVTLDRRESDWSWWITESRSGNTRTSQQEAKEEAMTDLLSLVGEMPMTPTARLAELLDLPERTCLRYLEELQEANLVRRAALPTTGGRPASGWIRIPSDDLFANPF